MGNNVGSMSLVISLVELFACLLAVGQSLCLYAAFCSKRIRLMVRLLPRLQAFLKDSSMILTVPHRW
jgi:hypothetical protein